MFSVPNKVTPPMGLGNISGMFNSIKQGIGLGNITNSIGVNGGMQPNQNTQGYSNQPMQNQQGFGNQNQQGFGGQPQQSQGFGMQNQQGFGAQPQNQGFGGQPQNQGFGGQPQNQGFGNQNQQGFGNQNQQGFGAQPQQSQGFNNQPQQGFGGQPQNQGFGNQNQGFGAQPQQAQQNFGNQNAQSQWGGQPQQSQQNPQNFGGQPTQPRQRPAGGGVVLKKGQKTSLSQMCPGLDLIEVGLGWDLLPGGQAYDLDVEAFMLGANGKVIGDDWFVFYGSTESPDNSVMLMQDSKDGAGAGDDEIMMVKLSKVNPQVTKIVFVVTINEAKIHGYNFSNIANAYIRVVDKRTGQEIFRFNLTDYYSNVCSMMVGEIYRHNGEWKFTPIGDGTGDDLEGLCIRYGVNVEG